MIERILTVIFPNKCPYCGRIIKFGLTECEECFDELDMTPKIIHTEAGITCISALVYDSKVRRSLLNYKFKGILFNAKSYAKVICGIIENMGITDDFDVITFVPLSKLGENERGFNQAKAISEIVGEYLNKPCICLLKKTRDNKKQHELNLQQRRENVKGVYAVCKNQELQGKRILLIDDIVTTGNTLAECCKVLQENGAGNVICIAAASGKSD